MNKERDLTEMHEIEEIESEPKIMLTRKQKISDWTRTAKSRVMNIFSRLMSMCRKSRK